MSALEFHVGKLLAEACLWRGPSSPDLDMIYQRGDPLHKFAGVSSAAFFENYDLDLTVCKITVSKIADETLSF